MPSKRYLQTDVLLRRHQTWKLFGAAIDAVAPDGKRASWPRAAERELGNERNGEVLLLPGVIKTTRSS